MAQGNDDEILVVIQEILVLGTGMQSSSALISIS